MQTSSHPAEPVQACPDEPVDASSERFHALLPRVVARVVGDAQAAREAVRTGGFILDESTVVLRLNPHTDCLEMFCDVGLPLPGADAREQTLRAAMEMNLCRTHPDVTFGLHPESGRLVATMATPMSLLTDDEACLETLVRLARVARQRREDGTFAVSL